MDLLKDQVAGTLAKQASGFLGESESGVSKALGGLLPAIMGGAVEKVQEPSGAQGILDMIGGLDLGKMSDIAGIFGGGASSVNGLLNSGGGIVKALLGDKVGGIVDFITNMAGLKSSSTSSLLKMAAPFVMGLIGKQIKGKGIGALKDLLLGQKSHIASAMPGGLGNVLGFANLGGKLDDAADAVRGAASSAGRAATSAASGAADAAGKAASTGMGWIKWALPLLLALGAIYMFTRGGCGEKVMDKTKGAVETVAETGAAAAGAAVDVAKDAGDAVAKGAGAVADVAKAAFSKVDEGARALLDKLTFVEGSAGSQMRKYIDGGFAGDPVFRFKNLNFNTGSAELKAGSMDEIKNVAAILKAYPGVNLAVEGYTDNTGDAAKNKDLSLARATTVMNKLRTLGIGAGRLSAAGFGADNPIGDNATAEGRAENRRIEMRIK